MYCQGNYSGAFAKFVFNILNTIRVTKEVHEKLNIFLYSLQILNRILFFFFVKYLLRYTRIMAQICTQVLIQSPLFLSVLKQIGWTFPKLLHVHRQKNRQMDRQTDTYNAANIIFPTVLRERTKNYFLERNKIHYFPSFIYLRLKYFVLENHHNSYTLKLYRLKVKLLFLSLIEKRKFW
jgi:hypothetical protein